MSSAAVSGKVSFGSLFAVRSFRDLWLGQTISQLGDSLYYLVFLFMVERLTHDPKVVALCGIAQTIPFLVLAPLAGVIADQQDRRKVMLAADFSSSVLLGLFALLVCFNPTPPAWSLILTGALLSCVNVFFAPAKSAAIPQLVPSELLTSANSLSMATQNLMPMIGVALSGTALAALYLLSPQYFFLAAIVLNALSFFVSGLFLLRLPALPVAGRDGEAKQGSIVARFIQDTRDGVAYMRRESVLWVLLWVNFLVQAAVAPFMIVYVEVNSQWFGGGFGTLALCEASFFLGAVAISPFMDRFPIRRPGIAYIISLVLIGITIAFMAISRTPWLFAVWNFLAGLAFPFAQVPMTTYTQKTVPENFQGRVNAVMSMAGMGIQPLSIGLGGILLAAIGPAGMLTIMGVGMAVAALLGLASRPFREAGLD